MLITTSDGNYRFRRINIDFIKKDFEYGAVIAYVAGVEIALARCAPEEEKQREYLTSIFNCVSDMMVEAEQRDPYRPEQSFYCEFKYKSLGRFPNYKEWLEMDRQRTEEEANKKAFKRRSQS